MCGRYGLFASGKRIQEHFDLQKVPGDLQPRYNIAPQQDLLTVGRKAESPQRGVTSMRWGLVPRWADQDDWELNLINARSETVHEKNSFMDAFQKRRCLIPASGFYEWRPNDNGKQPYWIHPTESDVMAFAGLWERNSKGPEELITTTILTTEAFPDLEDIHERMPVILSEEEYDDWLEPYQSTDELKSLLKPYEPNRLDWHPVSRRMNNAGYDEPDCVEPSG